MKYGPSARSTAADAIGSTVDRRGVIVGAGAAGLTVVAMQALRGGAAGGPVAVAAKTPPAKEVGYQVTPHVLRYYETAKS